ncbi:MAG TPA: ATP-binding protein [Oligoflexus sp.]|uniref:ATP-binding protein n=1 Tax=Oligoflexus sp. TaxID=1971216 RepID=UPI002D69CFC8|nr:ATP-binding protein [Oligoflexus sp.]HYX31869.1 ATP-binding protein [Oligoflexus sp.]
MMQPTGFLRNQLSEPEQIKILYLATGCGMFAYLPFGFVYPLLLGPLTIDHLWERTVLALIASLGLLLPHSSRTRPWMQAFIYSLCFIFSAHLFSLVVRNDMNVAYQLGYICTIALIAFYLDTSFIFFLYVMLNAVLLVLSLFYKISYESLFFGMIIGTILGIEWLALLSRLRVMKSLEESRAEVMQGAAAIQEKNRKIQSILESIQQGVLTVESTDGRIGAECSTFLYQLMGCEHPDELRHLKDILERTQLSKDQVEQVLSAVACIIHENDIAFALNYHMFPRSLREGTGATARYWELDWNPVYDSDGLVVNLLVCIRDVTELHQLRLDAARGQQELSLLAELVNIPRDRRESVLDASANLLTTVPLTQDASPAQILRMVHTLKGNARSFGLLTLADAAHECESLIQQGQKPGPELFEPLGDLLLHYRRIAEDKLGDNGKRDDLVSIPRQQLRAAVTVLNQLTAVQRETLQPLFQAIHGYLHVSFQHIVAPLLHSLPQLAKDLGKSPPVVQIVDPGLRLQQEGHDLIRNVILHLLRNALDHGLESPMERSRAQKSPEGHIWMVLKPLNEGLEILFHDDGRGLNLAGIQRIAVEKGVIQTDTPLSPHEVADLIFHAGISTKKRVTSISGRGVGLDAVRSMLEEAGGSIQLNLDEVKGLEPVSFTFVLHLPHTFMAQ